MIDFSIRVAHTVIRFKSDDPSLTYDAPGGREFKGFLCDDPREPDILLEVRYGSCPDLGEKETLFSVDTTRAISRAGGKIYFEYPDRTQDARMEGVTQDARMDQVVEINEDMTEGIIHVNRKKTPEERGKSRRRTRKKKTTGPARAARSDRPDGKFRRDSGQRIMNEIRENFLMAFLVEYMIVKRIGFFAHCASVEHEGELCLFMGQSGAGKSTIAQFWQDSTGARVLNDDRALITVKDGVPRFYAVPWTGTLGDKCDRTSGDGTRIGRIYCIYHHDSNAVRRLGATESAAKTFANSFPVFWHKSSLDYVLDMCSQIAHSLPCYELGFVNDESVVGFLKEELKEETR